MNLLQFEFKLYKNRYKISVNLIPEKSENIQKEKYLRKIKTTKNLIFRIFL